MQTHINYVVFKQTTGLPTQLLVSARMQGSQDLRQTTLYELLQQLDYQSGVDEQLVMERTGHRSLDGV